MLFYHYKQNRLVVFVYIVHGQILQFFFQSNHFAQQVHIHLIMSLLC